MTDLHAFLEPSVSAPILRVTRHGEESENSLMLRFVAANKEPPVPSLRGKAPELTAARSVYLGIPEGDMPLSVLAAQLEETARTLRQIAAVKRESGDRASNATVLQGLAREADANRTPDEMVADGDM